MRFPVERDRTSSWGDHGVQSNLLVIDMFGLDPLQSHRRCPTGVLALLVAMLCAPLSAHAGCGDYVIMSGRSAHSEDSARHRKVFLPTPVPANHPLARRLQNGQDSIPEQSRCHGPGCSSRSIPLSAPATDTSVSIDHWGDVSQVLVLPVLAASRLLVERRQGFAEGCRSSIFRPPRDLPCRLCG